MTDETDAIDWSVTTREGSRRAQLRFSLQLSLRERLEATEETARLAQTFSKARAEGKPGRSD